MFQISQEWKWRLHVTFPSTERVLAVSDVLLVSDVNAQVVQTGLCCRTGLKSSRTINVQLLLSISQILLRTAFIQELQLS